MIFYSREEVIAMTPLWKGERFEDGRPRVADRYLDALYSMTLEELWKPIFVQGYENNFVSITPLHPEFNIDGTVNRKMVGRAVT
ncbi:MAG: RraA family protein, partial [Clostridia bacterium]|nr:RraA family protein [Clostridia bacterium]